MGRLKLLIIFVLALIPALALANEVVIKSGSGDESLTVPLPDGWHLAWSKNEHDESKSSIREYISSAQSLKNWDNMITVIIFPANQEPPQDAPQKLATANVLGLMAFCKRHVAKPLVGADKVNAYNAAQYAVSCFMRPEAKTISSEVYVRDLEFYKGVVIAGHKSIYQIQWATHTNAIGDGSQKPTAAQIKDYKAFVKVGEIMEVLWQQGVSLCERNSSEHPCH